MSKGILNAVWLSVCAVLLLGSTSGESFAADKVRIGLVGPTLTTAIFGIALSHGSFDKFGIELERSNFPSGQIVSGVEQVIRGDLDVFFGASSEAARANSLAIEAGGQPPVAVIEGSSLGVVSLVLAKKYEGKTIDELKGLPLQIGVSSPSSNNLIILRYHLDELGLTDQMKWRYVTVPAENMPAALLSGQIDGFQHSEPTSIITIQSNAGFYFWNAARGDFGDPVSGSLLVASRKFLKDKPDVARRLLMAFYDATDYYKAAPRAEMVKVMADWAKIPPEMMDAVFDRWHPEMAVNELRARRWWDVFASTMIARGEVIDSLKFEDVFDLSFQRK